MRILFLLLSLAAPAYADLFTISGLVTASTEPSLPVGVEYLHGTAITDGTCVTCNAGTGLLALDFTMYWGTSYSLDSFTRSVPTGNLLSFSASGLRLVLYDYAEFFGNTFVDTCHAGDCGTASGTLSVTQVTPEPAAWFLLATAAVLSYWGAKRLPLHAGTGEPRNPES
jgi:hypothetical protein